MKLSKTEIAMLARLVAGGINGGIESFLMSTEDKKAAEKLARKGLVVKGKSIASGGRQNIFYYDPGMLDIDDHAVRALLQEHPPKHHGGHREGAGRKPLSAREPTKRKTVTLTEAEVEYLREIGSGNVSRGIRVLIAEHRQAK